MKNNNIVSSQSLSTSRTSSSSMRTTSDEEEEIPSCPCFDESDLVPITGLLLKGEIELIGDSCDFQTKKKETPPSLSSNVVSIKFHYRKMPKGLSSSSEGEEDSHEEGDMIIDFQNEDTTNENNNMPPPPPTMGRMNGPPGRPKAKGYTAEILPDSDWGVCNGNWPHAIPEIVYSKEAIESCVMHIENQCTMIQQSTCPCYDRNDIIEKLTSLAELPSSIVMDIERSCQRYEEGKDDPTATGVFGIFEERMMYHPRQPMNDTNRRMKRGRDRLPFGRGTRKAMDGLGSQLTLGVDVIEFPNSSTKKCYASSTSTTTSSDSITPSWVEHTVQEAQWIHCVSLMEDLCSALKPKPIVAKHNGDDPNYRKNDNPNKSCTALTQTPFLQEQNCPSYDKNTKKHVFEHCRESCRSGTCTDHPDFYYNGQPDKGCDWIAAAEQKEYFCAIEDVAKYCVNTCNSKCCSDDEQFEFMVKRKMRKCSSLRLNPNQKKFCRKNSIASKCPRVCGKCMMQPKNI